MWVDFQGRALAVAIGDMRHPDDPRGREVQLTLDFGVPTGQFDSSFSGPAEYGSWGFCAVFWRWGISVAVAGPILGHYPPDPDEEA